jgi:hypothetical protein
MALVLGQEDDEGTGVASDDQVRSHSVIYDVVKIDSVLPFSHLLTWRIA